MNHKLLKQFYVLRLCIRCQVTGSQSKVASDEKNGYLIVIFLFIFSIRARQNDREKRGLRDKVEMGELNKKKTTVERERERARGGVLDSRRVYIIHNGIIFKHMEYT